MVINIILLLVFIACIVKIVLILVSKFPMVANIDLKQIPQEREKQTKRILFEHHVQKKLHKFKNRIFGKKNID